jgi:acetolactate synthase-1/2/3 large subunit
MNGADAMIRTLADCGVTACFANPGTSEMHLVTALDREPRIRSVLCLFEGVATGAADGFARIAGRPAMTLLHLGPGYLNGGANLHNAKKAFMPSVNVVGDHATYHRKYDAPLTSDIEGLVKPLATWVGVAQNAGEAGAKAAEAYAASFGPPPGCAFLVTPADSAWSDGAAMGKPLPLPSLRAPDPAAAKGAAEAMKASKKPVVLISGNALMEAGLKAAARIAATGVRIFSDTFPANQVRGAGVFAPARLPYFAESALEELAGTDLMVVVGAKPPVAFFAYPGKASVLVPEGCETMSLGGHDTDAAAALALLADALGAPKEGPGAPASVPAPATGSLNAYGVGAALARHMPEGAIISDDGVTSGLAIYGLTVGAARHYWLYGTGGAIGDGMPVAVGAAVAAPDAKVICLAGDGAGMYTNQALWTMARENLDVLTIVFANRTYRILTIELARTGAGNPGPTAQAMLSLDNPAVDWVKLAEAQGVPAARCTTAEDFDRHFARMIAQPGPKLIEAVI